MDIDALRCFIAVIETGSYTRAAEQVHRSQSAISQKMNKLEEQINKPLFDKSARALTLTEDGKLLLSYARHILSLHDDALRQLQASQRILRPLQLGCPDDYAASVLPDILALIRQAVPNLPVRLHCHNSLQLRQMLDTGDLDVSIVSRSSSKQAGILLTESQGVWAYNGNNEHLASLIPSLVGSSIQTHNDTRHALCKHTAQDTKSVSAATHTAATDKKIPGRHNEPSNRKNEEKREEEKREKQQRKQAYKTASSSIPLILFDESCHFHHIAVQGLSQLNIPYHIVAVAENLSAISGLVMSGQGITVVARHSLGQMNELMQTHAPFTLPNLSGVAIEMIISAAAHPNFGRSELAWVCEQYQNQCDSQHETY